MSIHTSADPFLASALSAPSEEQRDLRSVVSSVLAVHGASERIRLLMQQQRPVDDRLWASLARDMGLIGLAVPDEFGGIGAQPAELALVCEELGRTLAGAGFVAGTVAAAIVAECGTDEVRSTYLPAAASGAERWAVSWPAAPGADRTTLHAVAGGDGARTGSFELTGRREFVLDGLGADRLVVVGDEPVSPTIYLVELAGPGINTSAQRALDLTRGLAAFDFDGTPAVRVDDPAGSATGLSRAWRLGALLIAAEAVGGASRCLEMAAHHAGQRYQFGRLIGSYQAISHRCADGLVELELARAAVGHAIGVHREETSAEGELSLSVAKVMATGAFIRLAEDNIQVHGGIGVTWEHDAHLYLKRAQANRVLYGDLTHHRRRVSELAEL